MAGACRRELSVTARLAIGCLLAIAGATTPSRAAERIGSTETVVNSVTGSGVAGTRTLAAADPVYRSEEISAAAASRSEMSLLDGTKLLVGENSTITLDRFVIAEGTFRTGTVRLAKGAFRFISGESHEALTITTPLADIGVRGTILDVYALLGVTRIVLINGEVIACSRPEATGRPRECATLRRSCDVVEITPEGGVERSPFLYSASRSLAERREHFALTEDQFRYGREFRAFMGGCSARAAEELRDGHGSDNNNDNDTPQGRTSPRPPPNPPPIDVDLL